MNNFSSNIKNLRMALGLSQAALADDIDTKRANIGAWEEGRGFPKPEMLIKLANYFSLSIDDLITKNISNDVHVNVHEDVHVNVHVKDKKEEINETVEVYNKGCVNCKDKERIIQQLQVRIKEYQERITELSTERKEYKEEAYLMRTELRILQNEHNNLLNQLNNSNSKAC